MLMKRFFGFCTLLMVAACGTPHQDDWFGQYGTEPAGTPAQMQYGVSEETNIADTMPHNVAVLLPLSGQAATTGRAIRTSVETAVLQHAPQNLSVAFYDTAPNATDAINSALATNPEIVIGPLFSGDARLIRELKPETMPVLSFTSDATAIGGGVMTMALMPTNSVEAIVREMPSDGVKNIIVLAPDTTSGRLMAGTAKSAAEIYNIGINGIFYYTEKDSESIKSAGQVASMNTARVAANTRAREILSDILTKERLTAIEKSSLNIQLEKISKSDTLGPVPYDAVLFLGDGDDTESLASFLRYYGVPARGVRFYGTAMWDGSDITSDFTMSGAKYAALPEMSPEFANLYQQMSGTMPSRLATFGYDATNMAIGMIYANKSNAAYLLDPSGYVGIDGLFRLKPTGDSERALRIVELNGTGTPHDVKAAPTNFITPIYNIEQRHITPAREMPMRTPGINPMNYIQIPERFRGKYTAKTYGANMTTPTPAMPIADAITILPEDDSDVIISPDFQPVSLESVNRTYIESVEIEE